MSGRRQLVIVSETREIELAVAAFADVKKQEPASHNHHYNDMVERVGRRIAAVAGRPDYRWEFHVIESDQPNAFCLSGGKVVFYEGILPICESEAGVAVVMSHEIAHALARHGGERMSHGFLAAGTGNVINVGNAATQFVMPNSKFPSVDGVAAANVQPNFQNFHAEPTAC